MTLGLERAREVAPPSFLADSVLAERGKSLVVRGTFDGEPAALKFLTDAAPRWRSKFAHEVGILRRFAAVGSPVTVPDLLWADVDRGAMIQEFIPGTPLGSDRVALQAPIVELGRLIEATRAITSWTGVEAPARAIVVDRYLSSLGRCVEQGLLERGEFERASRLLTVLACEPMLAHGDMLLSNILLRDGKLVFIDWEHARRRLPQHDLAFIWLTVAWNDAEAEQVVAASQESGGNQYAAFLLNALLLAALELQHAQDIADEGLRTQTTQHLAGRLADVRKGLASLVARYS